MSYTQANRLLALETPLGPDVLLLQGFTCSEAVSHLFSLHLDLLSTRSAISFRDLIGHNVTITLRLSDGTSRYFNGVVSRFSQSNSQERFTRYQMEVVPWLWLLTRNADCRIFQNKTVPEIIQEVFKTHKCRDFRLALSANYTPREYCVQYRETDFNFVSRLMEQYGIFYFFQHERGRHTLVLADSASAYQPCPGQPRARYELTAGGLESEDLVTGWQVEQELRTAKYSLSDYNFETPSTSLLSGEPTMLQVQGNASYELFDYPGEYENRSQGEALAKLRMQEEEAGHFVASGSGVCRAFTPGYKFDLQGHYRSDMNTSYFLTAVQHVASAGTTYASGEGGNEHYSNHFTCIPASIAYRPARITPKPFVQGPQTALVVGKSGEEIWVDKYGRIKVQFYWDRAGNKDENSSCWIRVSQNWAGKNWGAMWVPRMGQEVVVSFLEGDPDRPLITGRVYNAEQTVPYPLPTHQTVSTLKSRSSKSGTSKTFNEIRFEDKAGSEQIFINAEKDMDLRVEKVSREFIGSSRHLIVDGSQYESVGGDKNGHVKGKHNEKIDGDMSLQVVGKQMEKITADQSLHVLADQKKQVDGSVSLTVGADQKETIGGGVSLTVGQSRNVVVGQNDALQAGQTVHIQGGMKVIIEAGMQLSLKGPGGFVDIGPSGVSIQGTMVLINSGGSAGSGPGAHAQGPATPDAPADPAGPETADDGTKFGKM